MVHYLQRAVSLFSAPNAQQWQRRFHVSVLSTAAGAHTRHAFQDCRDCAVSRELVGSGALWFDQT